MMNVTAQAFRGRSSGDGGGSRASARVAAAAFAPPSGSSGGRARSRAAAAVSAPPAQPAPPPTLHAGGNGGGSSGGSSGGDRGGECDFVVIGSGIGGLCAGALLAQRGHDVVVVESHYLAGGAAHSFEVQGFKFDAGPSFHMGLSDPPGQSPNPLKQVLDLLGESVECRQYERWVLHEHDGASWPVVADSAAYAAGIARRAGPDAAQQWRRLEAAMKPYQRGAALFPAAALRPDPGVLLTAARFFGPQVLGMGLLAGTLTGPFSALVDAHVSDRWLRGLLDLESFVLSGLPAKDTLLAEMAFMFGERAGARGRRRIDYPIGGSEAIIGALVRGLEKHGGRLLLRSHVEEVLLDGGRASGVALRPRGSGSSTPSAAWGGGGSSSPGGGGSGSMRQQPREVIRARRGVISNASVWDTQRLLPPGAGPAEWRARSAATPATRSFVHIHLGIDAEGLVGAGDEDALACHHLFLNQPLATGDVEAEQNVCIASIPTQFDAGLAPPGKAVIHAYTAGNEPFERWEGLRCGSRAYDDLKKERSEVLWRCLERVIPDVRARTELCLVGTPLTHARFLRRHRGSYGPAISAAGPGGFGAWPTNATPIEGLTVCGDSCSPGIGVPSAAASGMMAANSLSSVWEQLRSLDALRL